MRKRGSLGGKGSGRLPVREGAARHAHPPSLQALPLAPACSAAPLPALMPAGPWELLTRLCKDDGKQDAVRCHAILGHYLP